MMRIATVVVAGLGALSLAACESRADKAAEARSDAVKANANVTATQMENQADAAKDAGDKATAKALDEKADATREKADTRADAIEKQASKKD
jgi:hypothetical protein